MDILGWIRDQLNDFFGLGPLLDMFASGNYQICSRWMGSAR